MKIKHKSHDKHKMHTPYHFLILIQIIYLSHIQKCNLTYTIHIIILLYFKTRILGWCNVKHILVIEKLIVISIFECSKIAQSFH